MRLKLIGVLVTAALGFAQTRPEFEVASVKPAPPPGAGPIRVGCTGGPGTQDPGLLTCQFLSLTNLVTFAYPVHEPQLSHPDWMDSARFDLTAKIPTGATREQLGPMMQSLLADRFKLVVHQETRETAKYDLVVAKSGPKFKEAVNPEPPSPIAATPGLPKLDANGFPIRGPGQPGMTAVRGRNRMYQPQYTMDALASLLTGQARRPVDNATNLTGKYEIALYWVNDDLSTSDADSGPTLMQALPDQLGLRLEPKKGPVNFVIIDHIEKLPTEN
jgi:uncharacterized protein (TIGR03435 family)